MFNEIKNWQILSTFRTSDFCESTDLYLKVVDELKMSNLGTYISRADFILEQIKGNSGIEIFEQFREAWGIKVFDEDILNVNDFKRGFLWCFRAHTTSWSDNQHAKTWFLTSPEAIFVRRYEFWTWDRGFEECINVREGNYKEILLSLLKDGDYEVVSSPSFSSTELTDFIKRYKPFNGDYEIEELIEDYIECNPNYEGWSAYNMVLAKAGGQLHVEQNTKLSPAFANTSTLCAKSKTHNTMKDFTIKSRLTRKAYVRMMYVSIYKKPAFIIAALFGVYLLTTAVQDYVDNIESYNDIPWFEIICGTFLLLAPTLVVWIAVRQFASNPSFENDMTFTFSESGVQIQGVTFKSEFVWTHIIKQKEISNFLILYHNSKYGNFIDKAALTPDQLVFIKSKVRQK